MSQIISKVSSLSTMMCLELANFKDNLLNCYFPKLENGCYYKCDLHEKSIFWKWFIWSLQAQICQPGERNVVHMCDMAWNQYYSWTSPQQPPWCIIIWPLQKGGHCREVSIRVKCTDRRMVGMKNPGCCREVAVSGGSTVVFDPHASVRLVHNVRKLADTW